MVWWESLGNPAAGVFPLRFFYFPTTNQEKEAGVYNQPGKGGGFTHAYFRAARDAIGGPDSEY